MRDIDGLKHRHTIACYASNETGPLAYTPCRADGLDRNLRNLNPVDFWTDQTGHYPHKGLTLICKLETR
jgi:hypothetical protein